MRVYQNERLLVVDVDDTLVFNLPPSGEASFLIRPVKVACPYGRGTKYRLPHRPHIKILKNYLARGADVIVWSKNGPRWAAAVLTALGLDHLDIEVRVKPFAYVDDRPAESWIGERIYLQPDDVFGED